MFTCDQCHKMYDIKKTIRIYGNAHWVTKYCSAQCYTKALTGKTETPKEGSPIYVEYYSHENENCFKIDLPWSKYRKDTTVLCKTSDGYECAKIIAIGVIVKRLMEVL